MPSLFVMGVDENGEVNTYPVDQTDQNHSYIFDNGTLDHSPRSINIKLEADEDNSNDMLSGPMSSELADSQLVMMNGLDEVHFEDSLMQELDSGLMSIDEGSGGVAGGGDNYIMQHMDIRKPLSTLCRLLELRLGIELHGFSFVLQGTQLLESHKNLVDQCVQGEGVVQVNVQIQQHLKRINIIDVLKPAEDYVEDLDQLEPDAIDDEVSNPKLDEDTEQTPRSISHIKREKPVHEWQVDSAFKAAQDRLKIPANPEEWSVFHVRHWIQWAVRQFSLPKLQLSDWSITGADLFAMDIHDFSKIVPNDPGDIFWTHFELLRKMKVVAVIKEDKHKPPSEKLMKPKNKVSHNNTRYVYLDGTSHRAGGGNSGQIQLWQFLLELLTTRQYKTVIFWLGVEGEFKLNQPEKVAKLWGERKNKPTMNYEKLSRALRYYYEGDMISKVHGKRFVYKFVCDLKQLIGYSAVELALLVNYGNPHYRTHDISY